MLEWVGVCLAVFYGVQAVGKQLARMEQPKENVQAEVSHMEKADGSYCFQTASSLLANEQAYGKVGALIVAVHADCFLVVNRYSKLNYALQNAAVFLSSLTNFSNREELYTVCS